MKTNKIVFNSINIKEGVGNKLITFTPNNNLIYSTKNSVGKSTLLRLLIYSLGYDIPSTKKMQFSKLELTVNMDCSDGNLTLTRIGEYFHFQNNTTNKTILYLDLDNILSCIYGVNNLEIINNILATFYLDQEYGWTFLNKGKILGKLSFNGEELIRGLSDIDCNNLNKKLTKVQQKIQKYKYMQDISKYKAQIVKDNKTLLNNKYDEQQKDKLTFLKIEKSRLINELNELDDTLKKNKSFKDYINSYKLRVKNDEGIEIPVNEKTIIGYDDNNDFIIHKKKIIAKEILHINKNIKELEKEVSNSFTDTETLIDVDDTPDTILKRLKEIYDEIKDLTISDEGVVLEESDCSHLKEDSSSDDKFRTKTKLGYDIVKVFKDLKDYGRLHVIVKRPRDFAIGLGYDYSRGEWAQGRYDYKTLEDAEKALKDDYEVREVTDRWFDRELKEDSSGIVDDWIIEKVKEDFSLEDLKKVKEIIYKILDYSKDIDLSKAMLAIVSIIDKQQPSVSVIKKECVNESVNAGLTEKFKELLSELDFDVYKDSNGSYRLYDRQGVNLGSIDEETFEDARNC